MKTATVKTTKQVTCLTTWNGTDYYFDGSDFISGNESGYDVEDYELINEVEANEIAIEQGFERFKIKTVELELA